MKLLRNITNQDIDPNSETIDTSSFKRREATRAVVINDREEVYLLHISSQGCHKLPGGGIEEGEGLRDALARELLEGVETLKYMTGSLVWTYHAS